MKSFLVGIFLVGVVWNAGVICEVAETHSSVSSSSSWSSSSNTQGDEVVSETHVQTPEEVIEITHSNKGKLPVLKPKPLQISGVVDAIVDIENPPKITVETVHIPPKPIVHIRDPSEIPELQRCRHGDEKCIQKMINIGLKNLHAGVPRLNLLSFDPLYAHKTLRMQRGKDSLVNLDFLFSDNEILGYRNHECVHVQGFNRNPVGEYEIWLNGPGLTLHGTYDLAGSLYRTPVEGHGYSNFTVDNTRIKIKFTGKTKEINGRIHLYTDNLKVHFTTTRLHTDLRNLFNGHEILGRVTNSLFNEHWRHILDEMEVPVFDALAIVYQHWLNSLLETVPYEDFFLIGGIGNGQTLAVLEREVQLVEAELEAQKELAQTPEHVVEIF